MASDGTTSIETRGNQGTFCPHLGLHHDPQTSLSYPSPRNICYRSDPAATPRRRYQLTFCQSEEYGACPVYTHELTELPPDMLHGVSAHKFDVWRVGLEDLLSRVFRVVVRRG